MPPTTIYSRLNNFEKLKRQSDNGSGYANEHTMYLGIMDVDFCGLFPLTV